MREAAACDQTATERDLRWLVYQLVESIAVIVMGHIVVRTDEIDDMRARRRRPITADREFGDQGADCDRFAGGDVRHPNQEVRVADLEVVAVVLEPLKIRAMTYQWP